MATKSRIQWTNHTWNIVTGCQKVSPGCENCYAITMSKRLQAMAVADRSNKGALKYLGTVDGNDWSGKVFCHPEVLEEPLRWKKPSMIFVCSMADLFHHDVPAAFILKMLDVMASRPQHTFQILTKRPERAVALVRLAREEWQGHLKRQDLFPDNVWFGVTCENQKLLDKRLPILMQIPAKVRWLSVEPMLGPIRLPENCGVDWIVVGGESGPNARPMNPAWARSLRDQCRNQAIPYFFKQFGEWVDEFHPAQDRSKQEESDAFVEIVEYPDGKDYKGVYMYRVGKKAAGRLLDGREHNEYPEVRK